jgi:hypothetical protein
MLAFCVHIVFCQKSTEKKRSNKSDVPGSNTRFLCPKSKIIIANTYTSSIDMLLCHFIKSFPNFETLFDKISRKKNYKKKQNLLNFFKCCNTSVVRDDWNNYLNIFNKPLKILVKQPLNMFIFFGEKSKRKRVNITRKRVVFTCLRVESTRHFLLCILRLIFQKKLLKFI